MKFETLLFAALGAGVGYIVLKQISSPPLAARAALVGPNLGFPALTMGGKLLTPRQAMQGAYLIGYSDGKGGRIPAPDVIAAMQNIG